MKIDDPVGVYDSGIGGMTLLHACARLLPSESFCYYGDNANAPYGGKSNEEILRLAERVMDFFSLINVKAAVIACNTVTTECACILRKKYSFPIIGTEPALRLAGNCEKPLVLATAATLRSPAFLRLKEARKGSVQAFAPVNLVGDIEKFAPDWEKIGIADHLPETDCDGVVLGCTHFIYLKEQISRFYHAPCYDGNEGTAKQLKRVLEREGTLKTAGKGKILFAGDCKVVNEIRFKQMFSL